MKLLLGSLLLAQICWLGAARNFRTMPNFDAQRVSGNWHPAAIITVERNFFEHTLTPSSLGNVLYIDKHLENGICKTRSFDLARQEEAGTFKVWSPITTQVLDTDYETYMITYNEQGLDSVLSLTTKAKTRSSELEKKFKDFASSVGVTGEFIPVVRAESC